MWMFLDGPRLPGGFHFGIAIPANLPRGHIEKPPTQFEYFAWRVIAFALFLLAIVFIPLGLFFAYCLVSALFGAA